MDSGARAAPRGPCSAAVLPQALTRTGGRPLHRPPSAPAPGPGQPWGQDPGAGRVGVLRAWGLAAAHGLEADLGRPPDAQKNSCQCSHARHSTYPLCVCFLFAPEKQAATPGGAAAAPCRPGRGPQATASCPPVCAVALCSGGRNVFPALCEGRETARSPGGARVRETRPFAGTARRPPGLLGDAPRERVACDSREP